MDDGGTESKEEEEAYIADEAAALQRFHIVLKESCVNRCMTLFRSLPS